jgi:mitogen-activated protein kinase 1/3
LYPAADPAAIDLLKKMLMFNPSKRCTADEALEHEFLKPVRRKEMEVRNTDMKLDFTFTPRILLNLTHPLILLTLELRHATA